VPRVGIQRARQIQIAQRAPRELLLPAVLQRIMMILRIATRAQLDIIPLEALFLTTIAPLALTEHTKIPRTTTRV
jgi:hypothetical protein